MAQITGYQCDVCGSFSTDPSDWIKITPYAKSGSGDQRTSIDVCSANCLVVLGVERGGTPKRRTFTAEQKLEVAMYAAEHGLDAAGDKYGVHPTTVSKWKVAAKL